MPLVNPLLRRQVRALPRHPGAHRGRRRCSGATRSGPPRRAALHLCRHRGARAPHLRACARTAASRRRRARPLSAPRACARTALPAALALALAAAAERLQPLWRPRAGAGTGATHARSAGTGATARAPRSPAPRPPSSARRYDFGGADAERLRLQRAGAVRARARRPQHPAHRRRAAARGAARCRLRSSRPGTWCFFACASAASITLAFTPARGRFVHAPHAGVAVASADLSGGTSARHLVSAGRFWERRRCRRHET